MQHFVVSKLHQYLLDRPNNLPFLLDVREPWEYEICHLNHSILVPMRTIPEKFKELNPEQETIVICHHGVRSLMVANFLEQQGFNNLINLTGGLDAWASEIDLNMKKY